MLPSLPRRLQTSALLRSLPSTTSSAPLTTNPSLKPLLRQPLLTLSRQITYHDPHSSTEVLPPSSSSSSSAPQSYTWLPSTRRTSFTSYALPYAAFAAESAKARAEGKVLDPRNHVHRAGTPMMVEVRRETVAGRAPGKEGGAGEETGMELLEGEVAERWIEEAGAVLALDGASEAGVRGGEEVMEVISKAEGWLETKRWWRGEYDNSGDEDAELDLTDRQQYEQWMACMEDLRVDRAFELEESRGEIFSWAAHRWGEDLGEWPEDVKGWLRGGVAGEGQSKGLWYVASSN